MTDKYMCLRLDEECKRYVYIDEEIIKDDLLDDMHDRAERVLKTYNAIVNLLSNFIDGNMNSFVDKIIDNNNSGLDICDILRDYELYKCRDKCRKEIHKDDEEEMREKIYTIFGSLIKKAETLKKAYTAIQKKRQEYQK